MVDIRRCGLWRLLRSESWYWVHCSITGIAGTLSILVIAASEAQRGEDRSAARDVLQPGLDLAAYSIHCLFRSTPRSAHIGQAGDSAV